MANKLEDLFTTEDNVDEAAIAGVLGGRVLIDSKDNSVYIVDSTLSAQASILAYVLAKKLLKYKGKIESAGVTYTELKKMTQLKDGTVDSSMNRLKTKGYLFGKTIYDIPSTKMQEVISYLEKKND